jgi:hypothetical protein
MQFLVTDINKLADVRICELQQHWRHRVGLLSSDDDDDDNNNNNNNNSVLYYYPFKA